MTRVLDSSETELRGEGGRMTGEISRLRGNIPSEKVDSRRKKVQG